MAKKKSSPNATKPQSIWDTPIKVDFKGLFKALASGVKHYSTSEWAKLTSDTVEVVSSFEFAKNPSGLAWTLVRRAMTRAILDLVGEAVDLVLNPARLEPRKY